MGSPLIGKMHGYLSPYEQALVNLLLACDSKAFSVEVVGIKVFKAANTRYLFINCCLVAQHCLR